eukprot:SAG22_NODE_402_length_11035_cov_6.315929_9_plen_294_part_00
MPCSGLLDAERESTGRATTCTMSCTLSWPTDSTALLPPMLGGALTYPPRHPPACPLTPQRSARSARAAAGSSGLRSPGRQPGTPVRRQDTGRAGVQEWSPGQRTGRHQPRLVLRRQHVADAAVLPARRRRHPPHDDHAPLGLAGVRHRRVPAAVVKEQGIAGLGREADVVRHAGLRQLAVERHRRLEAAAQRLPRAVLEAVAARNLRPQCDWFGTCTIRYTHAQRALVGTAPSRSCTRKDSCVLVLTHHRQRAAVGGDIRDRHEHLDRARPRVWPLVRRLPIAVPVPDGDRCK